MVFLPMFKFHIQSLLYCRYFSTIPAAKFCEDDKAMIKYHDHFWMDYVSENVGKPNLIGFSLWFLDRMNFCNSKWVLLLIKGKYEWFYFHSFSFALSSSIDDPFGVKRPFQTLFTYHQYFHIYSSKRNLFQDTLVFLSNLMDYTSLSLFT